MGDEVRQNVVCDRCPEPGRRIKGIAKRRKPGTPPGRPCWPGGVALDDVDDIEDFVIARAPASGAHPACLMYWSFKLQLNARPIGMHAVQPSEQQWVVGFQICRPVMSA